MLTLNNTLSFLAVIMQASEIYTNGKISAFFKIVLYKLKYVYGISSQSSELGSSH